MAMAPASVPVVPVRFRSPAEIVLPPLAAAGFGQSASAATRASAAAPTRRGFTGPSAAFKRLGDVAAAAVLLTLALPLLVAVAAALQCDSPGPVLFIQRRIGRGGISFPCLKLRTMRGDAENRLASLLATSPDARREWAAGQKLRRDPRVTPLGRLVRKLSLDELPQLANVLAGQMSLMSDRERRRERPGLARARSWRRKSRATARSLPTIAR